jgi:ubiquitin-conjugating enzyme E2 M
MQGSSFAKFRLQTELSKLDLLPYTRLRELEPPEEKYISLIEYEVHLREGIYEGRTLLFHIRIPAGYPFAPPKVLCKTRVYHPNIDDAGNVCMEILRLGWSPGLGVENVLVNLHVIFMEVCGEDALNTEAGELIKKDYQRFIRKAKETR